MNETFFVGIIKSFSHLVQDGNTMPDWYVFTLVRHVDHALLKRAAIGIFHDHVIQVIFHIKIEYLQDMRVAQGSHRAGFPLETSQEILPLRQVAVQDLDRHGAVQLGMVRLVHICHTPPAKALEQLVFSDRLTFKSGHFHLYGKNNDRYVDYCTPFLIQVNNIIPNIPARSMDRDGKRGIVLI